MVKAIFIDYTGTMVQEDEPYTRELLGYFIAHSDLKDPREILKVVWNQIKVIEAGCSGDAFMGNDGKVDRILEYCAHNHGLRGDFAYIHDVWRKVWVYAPLFDDVKPFFERTELPIYVLSNDDLCYLEDSMRLKCLNPAGIISAETVKACKPNRLIFEKALEVAGVKPEEAVLVGDSVTSDIIPAKSLGITPIYISRKGGEEPEGVRVIRSLDELTL